MGGNKKKTINIATKNTNNTNNTNNHKKEVETSKEPVLTDNSYELPTESKNVDSVNNIDINMDNIELDVLNNTVNTVNTVNTDVSNTVSRTETTETTEPKNTELEITETTETTELEITEVDNTVVDDDIHTNHTIDLNNNSVITDDGHLNETNADNNELVNNIDALNDINIIDLDPLDTFDTLDTLDTSETEDELENAYYESCINNIDHIEHNYSQIPAFIIDYTKSPTAGIRSMVCASETIKQYQGVEVFINNNQTFVRPFSPLSHSPFFGVAQHDAAIGEEVAITTSGITKIQVSKTIHLPYLIRSGNQCVFAKNQKNGTIMTQITSVPINTNDILVGYGTSSDTLSGPNSVIYSVNKSNNTAGRFIVHKKILINQAQCKFVIDSIDSNNMQMRKGINTYGRTIIVLDPMPESTDLCIVMI
jgi:hypothetical protein